MIDDIIDKILSIGVDSGQTVWGLLTSKRDDDRYDRFSSRITPFIFIILGIFMIIAQFVIEKPVVCWCPSHFTDAHVDYTNSYCWVKNTYYLPFQEDIPKKEQAHHNHYLRYYQFTIYIVISLAIFYYLPSVIWHWINSKSGVDSDDILHNAEKLSHNDSIDRNKLTFIVRQFKYLSDNRDIEREGFNRCLVALLYVFEARFSFYLVFAFMFTKLLYLTNAIGQFWLMNMLLFGNFNQYGLEIFGNVVADHNWENSPMVAFPRVTMCDIDVRRLGNVQRYTVQCTLPLNFLNEKIFMFIWFWMAIVAAVTVFGFLQWTLRILWPGDDYQFVSNHLPMVELEEREEKDKLKRFIKNYLKTDGVFLLRLISHNTNTLTTNEITNALWEQWN